MARTVDRSNKPLHLSSSITSNRRIFKQSNATGTANWAGTAYHSEEPRFPPGFYWSSCCSISSFLSGALWIIMWCEIRTFLQRYVLFHYFKWQSYSTICWTKCLLVFFSNSSKGVRSSDKVYDWCCTHVLAYRDNYKM